MSDTFNQAAAEVMDLIDNTDTFANDAGIKFSYTQDVYGPGGMYDEYRLYASGINEYGEANEDWHELAWQGKDGSDNFAQLTKDLAQFLTEEYNFVLGENENIVFF